ncbi:MAG: efflux RND transporter permease subunit [Pseudomonadota bacterium]
MKGIVAWFARNAVAANLIMIVAFIGGTLSFLSMEREFFPTTLVNGAAVTMVWDGASPQDIEDQLMSRIEESISDIDGLKRVTSASAEGGGEVFIEAENTTDMTWFTNEVERRVNQIANFPPGAERPRTRQLEAQNWFFGMAVHGNVDRKTLKRWTEKVRDDIALLPGGQRAVVRGVLEEEVAIEVTETNLRRYNLTFADVSDAVRGASLNSSGGQIRTQTGTVSIQTRQLADTAEEFENIIISQTVDGGTIRVEDVATVVDGFVDQKLEATFNGEPTAFVFVIQPEVMDIVEFSDGFLEYIENSKNVLPEALSIDLLWTDAEPFEDRMNTITSSALIGATLVLIVLLLFLRPIVAFWVTIGIITAFAGGTMLLPFFGVTFNLLSLFAVLLVIGVIVDDAIIIGENIHKEVETGRNKGLQAAIVGAQSVMKPVIFGVLTTIIAFLPWAFISGPERNFTEQISFVVMAALIFSLIECLLILPAHLAHMKPQNYEGFSGKLTKLQRRIADSLLWVANNLYKPILETAIRLRYATIAMFAVLFYLAIQLLSTGIVPFRLMPQIEGDLVQVNIQLPDGTPEERLLQVRDQFEAGVLEAAEELAEQYPQLPDGFVIGRSIIANGTTVEAFISMVPPENRPETASVKAASDLMREKVGPIPDAEDVSFDFTLNEEDTRVQFALSNPDLDRLREAALVVKEELSKYSTLYDVGDNLSSAAEEIRLTLKPGAQSLGITLSEVSNQVRQAYYGLETMRLPRDGEDALVIVRLSEEDRRSLDSLRNLRIRTADRREIPLTQIANLEFAPGINNIMRRERTRSVTVFAEVVGDARGQVMAAMDENFWPSFEEQYPDISYSKIGEFEQQQEFNAEIFRLFLIAIGSMYILLAVAFRSYAQPLLLMTAIPFAFAGAVYGHLLFGVPLALFSIFGIAAAAGVVINDNLVLVDYVNKRREEGSGAVQALVDAGVSRFRPILLTSVTTFVGILPLIAERSIGAQFLRPMVISLGCAVIFALFVSLLMVPALYAVGTEAGRLLRWIFLRRRYKSIGETYEGVANDDNERDGLSDAGNMQPAE